MTPNFNRIAPFYRWLEYLTFGPLLNRCRRHFLPAVAGAHRALVLGDGDGRFLTRLLTSNSHLTADAVDLSSAMLSRLSRRVRAAQPGTSHRLHTHLADARAFVPTGTYDLVVSHFFLDCLTQPELDTLALRLSPHLASGALWLISEFRIPEGSLRMPAQILVRSLYFGFRLLTGLRTARLPHHADTLHSVGLTRIAQHHFLGGLLTAELWQLKPGSPSGV